MAQEVLNDAKFRVVRDDDQGAYLLQVGVGKHYRTFSTFKLGKMDQLREQARLEALQPQASEQPSE